MRAWRIQGGRPLRGDVAVDGSKYSALAAIPACALANGACTLRNVPDILDVRAYVQMLRAGGADVSWHGATLHIDARALKRRALPPDWSAGLRASTYMLAVQLVRWHEAEVGLPGGDRIGTRPLDMHVKALQALGAEVGPSADGAAIAARCTGLKGGHVYFDQPSVGATVQALLAAVLADGETRLENAYVGPFIVDLANLLGAMGADIRGAGTSTVRIRGVRALSGVDHTLIGDQAEAFTFMAAAAATGGSVRVCGIDAQTIGSGVTKLREAGAEVAVEESAVRVTGPRRLLAVDVQTGPLPAFYTDYHPPLAAALATASGASRIVETVWRERFGYAAGLRAMGADVTVEGSCAVIRGGRMRGADVVATESRAAAAYAIAALAASGESRVSGIHHIERVCERFTEKLASLGARIEESGTAQAEA